MIRVLPSDSQKRQDLCREHAEKAYESMPFRHQDPLFSTYSRYYKPRPALLIAGSGKLQNYLLLVASQSSPIKQKLGAIERVRCMIHKLPFFVPAFSCIKSAYRPDHYVL